MITVKFRNLELLADKQLTKLTYDKELAGGAESCGCNYCKNFANYRDKAYPEEIKQLFIELGIDYKKESEICHYYKQDNGQHFYGGWFHFKGQVTGKEDDNTAESESVLDLMPITKDFSIGFRAGNALTFFEDKENLVQVEFNVTIPWTISEELEG
ncbi:MAG: hypothetical protein WBP45_12800 [Daejeonella sp.]